MEGNDSCLESDIEELEHIIDRSYHRLYEIMDRGYPKEYIFRPGRLLHNTHSRIDPTTNTTEYFYQKVLSYDQQRKVVLLSKEGSINNPDQLDEPYREFTLQEIHRSPIGSYAIRSLTWDINI